MLALNHFNLLSTAPFILVNRITWKVIPNWLWHQSHRTRVPPVLSDYVDLIQEEGQDRHSLLRIIEAFQSLPTNESPQYLTIGIVKEIIRKYSHAAQIAYLLYHGRTDQGKKTKALEKGFKDAVSFPRCKYPYGTLFDPETKEIVYGEKWNTIIPISTQQNQDPLVRLRAAALFGQKLVIDCSYDHLMREKELKSLANQVLLISGHNRAYTDPFDIILTNFKWNHHFMKKMKETNGFKELEELMISVYSSPVTEVLNASDCIYLSPHAEEVMETFDHNKCYIIGGMVDTYRTDCNETSFDYAKSIGVRSQRLPILVPIRKNKPPRLSLDIVSKILFYCKHENMSVTQAIDNAVPARVYEPPLVKQAKKPIVLDSSTFDISDENETCNLSSTLRVKQ